MGRLCDFGLVKLARCPTYTTCGTPDYLAPETVSAIGYHVGVDWWSWGIMLFELLTGHLPFEAAMPAKIYSNIMNGIEQVKFPKSVGLAKDLVRRMLCRNVEDRLPFQPGGISNIMCHSW